MWVAAIVKTNYPGIIVKTKPRKRKPGAGRPPAGPITGKVSVFSTRITAETRGALTTEAAASGRSISQFAEEMLELGLATRRERAQRSPIKALSYLVGRLAEECSVATRSTAPPLEWNTDAFVFDSFSQALKMLLEQLRPSANPLRDFLSEAQDVHPVYRDLLAAPETWAKHVFWRLWDEFAGTKNLPPTEPIPVSELKGLLPDSSDGELLTISRDSYSLYRARRDLGIGEKKS
jgi:hypothetical protein